MRDFFYRTITEQNNSLVAWLIKPFLSILSWIYGAVVQMARRTCSPHQLPRPVISVGNITWGGVGKTPLVELIAMYIKDKSHNPAILMRGYMPGTSGQSPEPFSDEAQMLRESLGNTPIIIGKNRLENAKNVLPKEKIDIFILDDGFQHWRIKRDLDIVIIDAVQMFGNGRVLPRGILREPLKALARADSFVITKSDEGKVNVELLRQKLKSLNPKASIIETIHQPDKLLNLNEPAKICDLNFVKGKNTGAFSSIGHPDSFKESLRKLGAGVLVFKAFEDHHRYNSKDIDDIINQFKSANIELIVTTHKDLVKLKTFIPMLTKNFTLLCLLIKIEITNGAKEFYDRIDHLL